MTLEFSRPIFEESSNIEFHGIRPVGAELSHTDRQIDMTELTVAIFTYDRAFRIVYYLDRGPGSSVGIATDYGLDGRRSRFFARPDRPWGPPSLLYNGYRVFPGGKVRPERAADYSPPSSAVVMEE